MNNEKILTKPRGVTSAWHLQQAKRLVEFDAGRHLDSVLVYAALELRSAIERELCELLLLLRRGKVTDQDKRQCRKIGGVFKLIEDADPLYRKTIAFTNIIASILPPMSNIEMVDTSRMQRFWSDLSELCHKQLDPAQTFESANREFQNKGFALAYTFYRRQLGGMQPCGEFGFPRMRDSKKQGKLGLDVGAPTVAQYLCMRKVGKPADSPRSPPLFSNQIRHTSRARNRIGLRGTTYVRHLIAGRRWPIIAIKCQPR